MLPMLAHDYNKRGKNIVWPAYVQPKLDGIRVLAHREANTVRFFSRNEKEFTSLGHLIPDLMKIMSPGEIFDGEIYVPGISFQLIASAVKRDHANYDSRKMQYWIFDIISDAQYQHRREYLSKKMNCSGDGMLIFVPSILAQNEKEMLKCHSTFVQNGYEGTIIRNKDAPYMHNRTIHLQKYKDFQDEEFQIIGGRQGIGKDVGSVIFRCITKDGIEFDVRPSASDLVRQDMWNNLHAYISQWLTVRFQNYSDGGTPRFPIGKTIRNYE